MNAAKSSTPAPLSPRTFQTILFAFDSSPGTLIAYQFACSIAERYGASLVLANAIGADEQITPELAEALCQLEKSRGQPLIRPDEVADSHTEHRAPVDRIRIAHFLSALATKQHADLIVLGSHGWTGLTKLIRGSDAEELAHEVSIPVLTVGPKISRGPVFERILYITDFSPAAKSAIPYAASLCEQYCASLDVLHVNDWNSQETPVEAVPRTLDFVREQLSRYEFRDHIEKVEAVFGERTERILEFASRRHTDLIVMGQNPTNEIRARLAAHLPGGVAYELGSKAHCGILTVPRQ